VQFSSNLLVATLGCDKATRLAVRGAKREAKRKAFMTKALFCLSEGGGGVMAARR
jgi:hypothetical protein